MRHGRRDARPARGDRRALPTFGTQPSADELLEGLMSIGVGDDDRRLTTLAILQDDAGDALALDEDAAGRAPEEQLAAVPLQPRDERVHESLKTPLTIERPRLEEALQHHGPVDERQPGGRQPEIRPQGGKEGLDPTRPTRGAG
jgi:hypothetical protein